MLNRYVGRPLRRKYLGGDGEIWLDNVECLGTETDLGECQHGGWAEHNCNHEEDVSISCANATGRLAEITKKAH